MITIRDIDINNKKVLIRCDLNVPIKDGKIMDDTRIKKSIKTIEFALKSASKVIILSHLGRVKTKKDMKENSLKVVCDRLEELLGEEIKFCTYDEDIEKQIENNKIILLENTRYFDIDGKKESNNDPELAKFYASLADVYINDAFGVCHRSAASTVGVSKLLPSAIGFLVEKEISKLSYLFNPKKPFILILGGSKVHDKIGIISNLIEKTDNVIIVGAMAFTFLKAKGIEIGKSICDDDSLDYCSNLMKKYADKIILPKDVYVLDESVSFKKRLIDIDEITPDDVALDIGPATIDCIGRIVIDASTVFLNGPAGKYEDEDFTYGTEALFSLLDDPRVDVIIGGGDSASAAVKFGYGDSFNHISTGGGAALKFLEGNGLDGLKYIGDNV